MQGREVGWTLQPDWSEVVAEALEPERESFLDRAWMLILGQQPLEPILKWVQVQVLKPEREPVLRQQARTRTKQLALSVLRLLRYLGIRCPCRNPRWDRRIARRVAC